MKYYFEKIKKFPYLHDKVEFSILFSSYDLSTSTRIKELKKYGFTKHEIENLELCLILFTNNVLSKFSEINKNCDNSILSLEKNRLIIQNKLINNPKNHKLLLECVEQLLKDCKKLGTIPFSIMARLAFIGTSLLKSMVQTGYLNNKTAEDLLNSIVSPLTRFRDDTILFQNKKITKIEFLKKYGHLRPGTYDITVPQYNQNHLFLNNIPLSSKQTSKIKPIKISKTKNIPALNFDNEHIFSFIKNSLTKREELKFEFTKNISFALELIVETGKKLGFSLDDLAHLDLKLVLRGIEMEHDEIIEKWKSAIKKERCRRKFTSLLVLPPLIFSENDFEVIQYPSTIPNYISNKKIIGKISKIAGHDVKTSILENRIILIENADPGYDWIFTKNPLGLITKYGGVASHIAIRCAELGLPAAIGCGEIIFDKLTTSSKVALDCKLGQILILENKIDDEDVEVQKVLKSLGYIK